MQQKPFATSLFSFATFASFAFRSWRPARRASPRDMQRATAAQRIRNGSASGAGALADSGPVFLAQSESTMFQRFLPVLALAVSATFAADATACGRVLVSGYFSNNVHVYDACTGAFQRTLDSQSRIAGAQAVRLHGGMLYVVSEGNMKILRYRADTLEYIDTFIETGPIGVTGVAFGPDGDVYVGGYSSGTVVRYDGATGALEATVASGFRGPDNGLIFGPDNKLYIPSYDGNSISRYDPATGQTAIWATAGSGGLRHTRGILFEPGGTTALVSSEGSSSILRYRVSDGGFVGNVTSYPRATGIAYGEGGELLLTGDSSNAVEVRDPQTGAQRRVLIAAGTGGLNGATFIAYLPENVQGPNTVDATRVGSQYWIAGIGRPNGRVLQIDRAFSANGAAFGSAFVPSDAQNQRWGALRIEWTGCNTAELDWDSTGADAAGFGIGGYTLQRLAANPAGDRCTAQGFAATTGTEFMAGTWYGGPTRDGEGLVVDALSDGQVLVSFFTHRPR